MRLMVQVIFAFLGFYLLHSQIGRVMVGSVDEAAWQDT
jgi:hypothetical protein